MSATGDDADRDARTGRFRRFNRAALVTGARSAQFWAAQAGARQDIEAALVEDAGFSALDDAPRALRLAVQSIAQAVLLQQSAFERLVESGGPLTHRDRTRRSFAVWLQAGERVHRGLQLVGIERRARDVTMTTREILLAERADRERIERDRDASTDDASDEKGSDDEEPIT